MKSAMTNHQLRQAINDTTAAMRPPIMGAKLPDDVMAKLQAHLSAMMEIECMRAAAVINRTAANGAVDL